MPYLSSNHRFEYRSKTKSLFEAGVFITMSIFAIFITIMTIGWVSVSSSVDDSYSQYVRNVSEKSLAADYR